MKEEKEEEYNFNIR